MQPAPGFGLVAVAAEALDRVHPPLEGTSKACVAVVRPRPCTVKHADRHDQARGVSLGAILDEEHVTHSQFACREGDGQRDQ